MSDINLLVEEICREYIKRIEKPNFRLKVIFKVDPNSDTNFSNLPVLKFRTENVLDEEFDQNITENESLERIEIAGGKDYEYD